MSLIQDLITRITRIEKRFNETEAQIETDAGVIKSYTDATRPSAGKAGLMIFNTDDGQLNIDNGTNWTLPDGTVT